MRLDTHTIRVELEWEPESGRVFGAIVERDRQRHDTRIVALGQFATAEDVDSFMLAAEILMRAHVHPVRQEALF